MGKNNLAESLAAKYLVISEGLAECQKLNTIKIMKKTKKPAMAKKPAVKKPAKAAKVTKKKVVKAKAKAKKGVAYADKVLMA